MTSNNFAISDDHEALRDVVKRFVDRNVLPTVAEREHNDEYPADLLPGLADLGVMGMSIPEEYGAPTSIWSVTPWSSRNSPAGGWGWRASWAAPPAEPG